MTHTRAQPYVSCSDKVLHKPTSNGFPHHIPTWYPNRRRAKERSTWCFQFYACASGSQKFPSDTPTFVGDFVLVQQKAGGIYRRVQLRSGTSQHLNFTPRCDYLFYKKCWIFSTPGTFTIISWDRVILIASQWVIRESLMNGWMPDG